MRESWFASATELAREIRQGRMRAAEVLEEFFARVDRINPAINAVVLQDREGARARAAQADEATARGVSWGPLHGVPVTLKESNDRAGTPSTWGYPAMRANVPERDAVAVARLEAAGAVIYGKTNVPIALADFQSYNPIYGVTRNPWNTDRIPGGSSGGAAAALAAGLTGLELGSDIGASIRNPAHYCGVFGHKPTYGICPSRGHALPGVVSYSDIAAIGPLARSAADLALALAAMAGPDDIESAGYRLALAKPRKTQLREFKVALMLDDRNAEVDKAVQNRLLALADFLRRNKVKVDETARPDIDTDEAQRVYIALLRAATSGRQTPEQFARNLEVSRTLEPQDESYFARMTRANVMHHKDWLAYNERRHHMRLKWADFFHDYDLLLCPAASSAAFPHDHEGERQDRTIFVNGKRVPTTDQLFWAGYPAMAYLPSTVAPAGLTPEGLPVGVQIVGPQYGDLTCIAFARLIEREFQGFVPPTDFA